MTISVGKGNISEQITALQNDNPVSKKTGSSTDIDVSSAKNLTHPSENFRKVLGKTYLFSKEDVENIDCFITALKAKSENQISQAEQEVKETYFEASSHVFSDTDTKKEVDDIMERHEKRQEALKNSESFDNKIKNSLHIKVGFLTKLKSLCAEILKIFGNKSKTESIQREGISQLKNLKTLLTNDPDGKKFLISFIDNYSEEKYVMAGLFKALFGINIDTTKPDDLKQNIEGVKMILNSDICQQALDIIEESHGESIDKLAIDFQKVLFPELKKLTIENYKNSEKTVQNIKVLLRASNFFDHGKGNIALEKYGFYANFLGTVAGNFDTFLKDFAKGGDLKNRFSEYNSTIKSFELKSKLVSYINNNKDNLKKMGTYSTDQLSEAARASLGDEEFLSQFKSEILDGSLKIKDKNLLFSESFANTLNLNDKEEVEGFVKACLWADKEMVENSLKKHLEKANGKMSQDFNEKNTIFLDINRGDAINFTIGDKTIKLNEDHNSNNTYFSTLQENMANLKLGLEEQEKIKRFCANFPSQGILMCTYNTGDSLTLGKSIFTFNVEFNKDGDTIVEVVLDKNNKNEIFSNFGSMIANRAMKVYETASAYQPVLQGGCEFQFTYKGGIEACKGSGTDVKVTKFEQNIEFNK